MVNQPQLTAKELFFNNIKDAHCLIIMCFHLDSLITELPHILLTNTIVICPKDQRKKLIVIVFDEFQEIGSLNGVEL